MNKNIILITVAAIAIAFAGAGLVYWWNYKKITALPEAAPAQVPYTGPAVPAKEDSTTVIGEDLNLIDIGDLDAEFQAIDLDLNSL